MGKPCHRVFDHLSEIERHQPDVKVITFNHEGIFSQAATDIDALKAFISMKGNLKYPIYVDVNRTAINGESLIELLLYLCHSDVATLAIFKPGQNLSIPLGMIGD